MALNTFDRIAFVYDLLARLVFGNSIINSQKYFLDKIQNHSKVLILGGGSGWLLAELLKLRPACQVWYIEASGKMIEMTKKKINPDHAVHFIHGTQNNIPDSVVFNVVITNFYLDLFTNQQLKIVVDKVKKSLQLGSIWIATDFVDANKLWQKMMLKMMYWFFRNTAKIESRKLPHWEQAIEELAVGKADFKFYYGNFIKTNCYQF